MKYNYSYALALILVSLALIQLGSCSLKYKNHRSKINTKNGKSDVVLFQFKGTKLKYVDLFTLLIANVKNENIKYTTEISFKYKKPKFNKDEDVKNVSLNSMNLKLVSDDLAKEYQTSGIPNINDFNSMLESFKSELSKVEYNKNEILKKFKDLIGKSSLKHIHIKDQFITNYVIFYNNESQTDEVKDAFEKILTKAVSGKRRR